MDHTDNMLKDYLQGWADRQPLPSSGRNKLLAAAAYLKNKKENDTAKNLTALPSELISWAMVYSLDTRFTVARLVS